MLTKLSHHLGQHVFAVVVLRVPALFVADIWYRTDSISVYSHFSQYLFSEPEVQHAQLLVLVQLFYCLVLLISAFVILLPIQNLINFYSYVISGVLLTVAYLLSTNFVTTDLNSSISHAELVCRIFCYTILHVILSTAVGRLLQLGPSTKTLTQAYILPLLACAVGAAPVVVQQIHCAVMTFVFLVTAVYLLNRSSIIIDVVCDSLHSAGNAVHAYGWIPFIVALWYRMLLPAQFLVFWVGLAASQLYRLWCENHEPSVSPQLSGVLLLCIAECCKTPLSFIGACVTLSYVANGVIMATRKFLGNPYVDFHRSVTEGLTMFLVGVQSSLVELDRSERELLTTVILFVAFSSLLQSIYQLIDCVLSALAVSQSRQWHLHVRAVVVCLFVACCSLFVVHLVWRNYDIDFWSIVVTSTCLLTSLQAVASLLVYGLLLQDSFRKIDNESNPFDMCDGTIYYVKSRVRLMELAIAIAFTGYSLERSVVGSCSWMNASIIAVHCYFNIWTRLYAGWLDYTQRREANKRLGVMSTATELELDQNNDVCTICYQEMESGGDTVVRVTTCRHFFHDICLRKWLFVQDFCPICSYKILRI